MIPDVASARGLGYLPDRPDARDRRVEELVAARGIRMAPDLRHLRTGRLLQGVPRACLAFATARAIHLNLQAQGHPAPPLPSPGYLYWNGRAHAYKDVPEALRPRRMPDVGTRPRDGLKAVQALGFCAWDAAPYDPRDVVTRPPRDAFFRAYDQKGLGYYRITAPGRVDKIEGALTAGAGVVLCWQVDARALWNRGDLITHVDLAAVQGGHAVTVLAVTPDEVLVDNWWDDWGVPAERWEDGGLGRLGIDFVDAHPAIMDVYAVFASPLYAEGKA